MPQIIPMEQLGAVTPQTTPPSIRMMNTQATQQPAVPSDQLPAKPVEATQEDKAKQLDSSRFAALSRKEREIFRRDRELKAERQRLEQQRNEYAPYAEIQKLAQEGKGLEAIKKLGFDYDRLTQEALNQAAPSPEFIAQQTAKQIAQQELEAYKQEQSKLNAEQQQTQYNQAINQLKRDARQIVAANPDKFEVVNGTNAIDTAVEVMENYYRLTGDIVSLEDALAEVDSTYEDGTIDLVMKSPRLQSKIKEKLGFQQKLAAQPPIQKSPQKPITNQAVASSQTQPMSAAEKRQRAIDVFYGRISS